MKTFTEPLYVSKSQFGKGVFATRDIKRGELICIMKGRRVSSGQLSKVGIDLGPALVNLLQIGKYTYLNLDKPYIYINHSCNPNAGLKGGIKLVATKNISKGEEVLYDYSTTWLEGFECRCSNKNCRKYISGYHMIPLFIRKKYRKMGIVPAFIKD